LETEEISVLRPRISIFDGSRAAAAARLRRYMYGCSGAAVARLHTVARLWLAPPTGST
jgi:hypothetical protein